MVRKVYTRHPRNHSSQHNGVFPSQDDVTKAIQPSDSLLQVKTSTHTFGWAADNEVDVVGVIGCQSPINSGKALHSNRDLSRMSPSVSPDVPVLAKVYSLPRPEGELAVCDGDVDRCPDQRALEAKAREDAKQEISALVTFIEAVRSLQTKT